MTGQEYVNRYAGAADEASTEMRTEARPVHVARGARSRPASRSTPTSELLVGATR